MGQAENKPNQPPEDECDDDSNISDQLHLLKSGDQSDVILKCRGESFNVHSHILSARSDELRKIIGGLDEKRELHLDVSPRAIEKILHYMYSGEVIRMSCQIAADVYQVAEEYGMETLRNKCGNVIEKQLNEANVCYVLASTEKHKSTYLKSIVIQYLIKRKSFLESEVWRGFCDSYPKLANEVFLAFGRSIK